MATASSVLPRQGLQSKSNAATALGPRAAVIPVRRNAPRNYTVVVSVAHGDRAGSNRRPAVGVHAAAMEALSLAPVTPPTGDYVDEYIAAVDAVKLASRLCQAVQAQLKNTEKVEKDDSSPVTVADYGAQALVAWSLQRALPDQPFSLVAEEEAVDLRGVEGAPMLARITDLVNAALVEADAGAERPLTTDEVAQLIDSGNSEGGPHGRHWVLDPIDGTRGFVAMRQYAVCLGLLEEGEVVLGVLGCPNLPQWAIADVDCNEGQACRPYNESGVGSVFAARRGAGAFAGALSADGLPSFPIRCNDLLAPEEVRYMESFEKRHSNHTLSARVAAKVGIELPSLRLDSQAKYGALSRGDASIFMRFPPSTYREKIWDHAAGAIIITEAGACISDAMGNPLDFSQGRYFPDLNGGIVAATPSMHAAIMEALRSIREEDAREE